MNRKKPVKRIHVKSGRVDIFDSQREAAMASDVHPVAVCLILDPFDIHKTANGYTFERLTQDDYER